MIDLIDAISKRLDEVFDGEYAIYLENVEQGLKTPCFFIHPIYSSDKNLIDNRKYRMLEFDIIFIPDEDTPRNTFAIVSNELFNSFDFIELNDGTIRYTFDRRIDVVDDVLHFMVTFKFDYLIKNQNETLQDSLNIRHG